MTTTRLSIEFAASLLIMTAGRVFCISPPIEGSKETHHTSPLFIGLVSYQSFAPLVGFPFMLCVTRHFSVTRLQCVVSSPCQLLGLFQYLVLQFTRDEKPRGLSEGLWSPDAFIIRVAVPTNAHRVFPVPSKPDHRPAFFRLRSTVVHNLDIADQRLGSNHSIGINVSHVLTSCSRLILTPFAVS